MQLDDGPFEMANGLGTAGWSWVKLDTFRLEPGEHTLRLGYREDGAKLDKISISNDPCQPDGLGEAGEVSDDPG